jgi:hypothetical protein
VCDDEISPAQWRSNLEPHFVKASLARCFSGSSGPVSLIHSEQVIGRSPHSITSHRTRCSCHAFARQYHARIAGVITSRNSSHLLRDRRAIHLVNEATYAQREDCSRAWDGPELKELLPGSMTTPLCRYEVHRKCIGP